jgi:HEPN domain-containing protein
MRKIKGHQIATLLGIFALAACDDTATQVALELLGPEDEVELALLEEPDATEVAVEWGAATNDAAASFGMGNVAQGRAFSGQADVRFARAHVAFRGGDKRGALEEAREARRLLARAIYATGGVDAVTALVERLEELVIVVGEEPEDFDNAEALAEKLTALAAEARAFLDAGDYVRAAERALFGEQLARFCRRNHEPRARLAVSLAGTAVQLATRLVQDDSLPVRTLGASNVREHRNRWLWHAQRMLEHAERALANGHWARAIHFAEHAHWSALKAVILPGGITDEELTAMVDLAHELYAQAEIDIGDDPTEVEATLFARAGRLIAAGEAMLADGKKRGVALVWRGAVISRWLMD